MPEIERVGRASGKNQRAGRQDALGKAMCVFVRQKEAGRAGYREDGEATGEGGTFGYDEEGDGEQEESDGWDGGE